MKERIPEFVDVSSESSHLRSCIKKVSRMPSYSVLIHNTQMSSALVVCLDILKAFGSRNVDPDHTAPVDRVDTEQSDKRPLYLPLHLN